MAKHERVVVGTEIKLKVSIDSGGNDTMDDYNFTIEAYCNPRKSLKTNKKDNNIVDEENNLVGGRIDSDNYYVCIDTAKVGIGNLKIKVTAYLPDNDFDLGERTEVTVINTNILIVDDN